jgi:hypothetical protein
MEAMGSASGGMGRGCLSSIWSTSLVLWIPGLGTKTAASSMRSGWIRSTVAHESFLLCNAFVVVLADGKLRAFALSYY